MKLEKIESVVVIEKQDGDYKAHYASPACEEAIRERHPHQLGELTIKVDDSNREAIPQTVRDGLPNYLKGNGEGVITMPVYVFGREVSDVLHIALHRDKDGSLKQIFGMNIDSIEDYKTLHEFYKI